jgi:hypothetical protein
VRVYAGQFPAEVAGLVLVDSSHPDQAERIHLPLNPAQHVEKWEPFLPAMHWFEILRIGLRQEPRAHSFSRDAWDEVLYLREKLNSYRAILRECEVSGVVRRSEIGRRTRIGHLTGM